MRDAILLCLLAAAYIRCGTEPSPITKIGKAANTLHLIPFQCAYLGISIEELAGCSIACPGATFYKYDLEAFTANLECTHTLYKSLQCGLAR